MLAIFVLLLVLVGIVGLSWLLIVVYLNDWLLPKAQNSLHDVQRVLIVFPHADDEALTCSNTIKRLISQGVNVTWVVLTQGEKGTPNGEKNTQLAVIRTTEAQEVAQLLGKPHLIQQQFPDGDLASQKTKLRAYLHTLFQQVNPELVITYDLSGLYGHPDHIVVSELVTELVSKHSHCKLWYATFPTRLVKLLQLPTHMATDGTYLHARTIPNRSLWIGLAGVKVRLKLVETYQSQRASIMGGLPFKRVPLWVYYSLLPFEYFHEVARQTD